MVYFANWQITGVICMTLLTIVSSQTEGVDYLYLTAEPVDQVFLEHSERNVMFECSTAGNPKPEILWMRNDLLIVENSKYQITVGGALVINNPPRGDHGDRFWCEARNSFGALRSRNATLEIAYVNQTSNTPLSSVTVNANRGRCLPCNPPGAYPGIQTQWRKEITSTNGHSIIQPDPRIMILSDGQLCFAYTEGGDSGNYDCSVANSYDKGQRLNFERSISVSLTVMVTGARSNQALTEIPVPANITVKQGEEAVLQCNFLGKPVPTLLWTRLDGRSIARGISVDFHQLRLPNAQSDDSGEYQCIATKGSDSRKTMQYLTVISPPVLTTELNDTEVSRLSSARFQCETANPGDEYSWYYNTEPITPDSRIQLKSQNVLFIKSTRMSDSGIYQCSVSNEFGAVFSTAQLRIREHRGSGDTTTTPSSSVTTPKQGVPDTEGNGVNERGENTGSGGNSSVALSSSTVLLLILMIYQKVL